MTTYLRYELVDGYIHNWLVAGPQEIAVPDLSPIKGPGLWRQIADQFYAEDSGIGELPIERASFVAGGSELTWNYTRCLDDHLIELSGSYASPHYMRSWAYAEVHVPSAQKVTFVLTTHGPLDLWVNDRHIHRHQGFAQRAESMSVQGELEQGANKVLVRFEQVAVRACTYAFALQIEGLPPADGSFQRQRQALWSGRAPFEPATEMEQAIPEQAHVSLPTATLYPIRREMLEHIFEQAHVTGYVHHKGVKARLRWAPDLDLRSQYHGQIQDEAGRVYVEVLPEAKPSETVNIGHPIRIWEGAYDVVIRPRGIEWFERNVRYERRMPIHILDHAYAEEPYGTYAERGIEALEHAAKHERNVYTQIARMQLGRWSEVNAEQVLETIEGVNARRDGSNRSMIGLLGMQYRYAQDPAFPAALKAPLEACILGWKYWLDESGDDVMYYETESDSILFHACEALAGQLYPDRAFSNAKQTGAWHREKGEELASAWLYRRATAGFVEWDSNCCFERDLLALSHLASLTENAELQDIAAVIMDKLLFTIATNSFKGVFGSTHGRSEATMVRSGQLEATSGISRMMCGMGVWNQHTMGIVGLACCDYELPLPIIDVAIDQSPEMWNREQHPGVNKVTYRTPDYMLCSAQDHHPGEAGSEEHIWQATMGPGAVVFGNHPACSSEDSARRPNFWRGNGVLPRVAQWKDTLVAVHKLPDETPEAMGFTHAYFPTGEFDEHRLRRGWAFARKGRAYLALTASCGLELVRRGPSAYNELRSAGKHNLWLCLMGRPDTDGSFEDFQRAVLALDVEMEGLDVKCTTLRGDTLGFGWQGPLLINGEAQRLDGFKHYDGPFCAADVGADHMDIEVGEYLMRLNFAPREDVATTEED